jgi:adenosylcobinamide amidohydrolase
MNDLSKIENTPVKIVLKDKSLIINLPKTSSILSWAPFNGGLTQSNCIFNHECDHFEENDLVAIFNSIISQNNLPSDVIGLITGANVSRYEEAFLENGRLWVHAIATVGLNNARSAGDSADIALGQQINKTGTINLIVSCNALPQVSGLVEALHLATMAKTSAMIEVGVRSKKSKQLATGTGTDCIVIAGSGEIQENYCGMHTVLGEMIGKAVKEIIKKGIQKWPEG